MMSFIAFAEYGSWIKFFPFTRFLLVVFLWLSSWFSFSLSNDLEERVYRVVHDGWVRNSCAGSHQLRG